MDEVRVAWSGGDVTGFFYGTGEPPLLLAHGAGNDQGHPRMVGLAEALAAQGLQVMTFNYPYTEAGKRRPDRQETLLEVHRAARDLLAERAGGPVVLAGRSMGGRMGTYLAAAGEECLGLVLYAYPLHPAGKPEKLRVDHLPDIERPMLFFQGTSDALSRMELFDRYVRPLPSATVEVMDGASHSLDRRPAQTAFLAERTATWTTSL
ncbi:MAG TPA: alpha/beta fold hydrolase [Acidimicrobiia bacterium]|nr:alpha/beta fold hydrolase [Acidimicrobiia bacterium]